MQLSDISRDLFLKPLTVVCSIADKKHTKAILANVLLEQTNTGIAFTTNDEEIQVQTRIDHPMLESQGAITVNAKRLLDIVKALPEGNLNLSLQGKKFIVQLGRSRFGLQTLPAEEYPVIAPSEETITFKIESSVFKYLLSMVQFAMATQDVRYYLNGVMISVEGNLLRAVSTDGHRMALCEVQLTQEVTKVDAIIPRKTVLELIRLLSDTEQPVQIGFGHNQVQFEFDNVKLTSKLVEGKFPDFNKIIPSGNDQHLTVDREIFASALTRSTILATDKLRGIRFNLNPRVLTLTSVNKDLEEGFEELEVDYEGNSLEIGFNVTYLLDVMTTLKSEQVRISFGDSLGSALITIPDSERFKYVVMPIRI